MVPARKFNGLSSLPDFFNDFFDNGGIERISTKAPAINVIEEEDKYKIEIATPGMTKDDFQIHVNKDGNLVIEMERKKEEEEKKEQEKNEQSQESGDSGEASTPSEASVAAAND